MKSYCYSVEKAQKNKLYFNNITILKMIVYSMLIIGITAFLALKINVMFVFLGLIIIVLFIIYNVLRMVKSKTLSLTSIVKDDNNSLYLIINNNTNDLSWIVAANNILKKSFFGEVLGTTVSIKLLHDASKKYEALKQIMSNEKFLNLIIENPKDQIANGIEIYKIIKINNCVLSKNSISFNYDGFEMSNSLIFNGKECVLLNVYENFEELSSIVKNYNEINKDSLVMNSQKEKEYSLLFEKNYKILKSVFYLYSAISVLDILCSILFRFNFNLIIIETILFCVILMYYEASKNTNLQGKKEIKNTLKYTFVLLILNFISMFIQLYK
ncbi:MAG: hypothetical protein MR598_04230 [Erysipelotrichaceae bacterium]|nr:hypothetical protein [Erysipelotrichaceae bacterium]